MNQNKKIKNLAIGVITFFLLSNYTYKLVKGNEKAKEVINQHENTNVHFENIVAHRGFSGLYPDNSYEALEAALKLPCTDMIEIDIRFTKDKRLILHHDSFISIDDLVIKIEDLVFDDLDETQVNDYPQYNIKELLHDDTLFLYNRFLNKASKRETIITLDDLIKWYTFQKTLILDIKTDKIDYDLIESLNSLVSEYKNSIFIQSDNYEFLIQMMKSYPDYKYIYVVKSKASLKNLNDSFYGYAINYNFLDKLHIENDKLYLVYTINSNSKFWDLLNQENYRDNMYVVTDNPDYICSLSEEKKLRK